MSEATDSNTINFNGQDFEIESPHTNDGHEELNLEEGHLLVDAKADFDIVKPYFIGAALFLLLPECKQNDPVWLVILKICKEEGVFFYYLQEEQSKSLVKVSMHALSIAIRRQQQKKYSL